MFVGAYLSVTRRVAESTPNNLSLRNRINITCWKILNPIQCIDEFWTENAIEEGESQMNYKSDMLNINEKSNDWSER